MTGEGKTFIRNIAITIITLCSAFLVSLLLQYGFSVHEHVTAIFVLAVFLLSDLTRRYAYGILASLVSMLVVNYAFTEPFFFFDFIQPENLISAVVMVAVSVFTCTLVSKLKEQEAAAARASQAAQMGGAQNGGSGQVAGEMEKPEIPTGGGYSALQRKVNETGSTEGMV